MQGSIKDGGVAVSRRSQKSSGRGGL